VEVGNALASSVDEDLRIIFLFFGIREHLLQSVYTQIGLTALLNRHAILHG